MDGNYFHHLTKFDKAYTILVKILHFSLVDLLNNPTRMEEIPELYQYKSIYIPKTNGSFRHIAIQESLCTAIHKAILKKIQTTNTVAIHDNQMALTQFAYVKCLKKVTEMNQSGFLVKIDIKKAFDAVPHSVI